MRVPCNQTRAALQQSCLAAIRIHKLLRLTFATFFSITILTIANTRVFAVDEAEQKNVSIPIPDDLSESDQLVFANNLQKAVADGDQDQINNLIDWNAFLEIATAGEDSPMTNRLREDFKTGFLRAAEKSGKGTLASILIENSTQGGTFRLLRFAKFENEQVAVFRLLGSNQGLNYHRYFLKRSSDGIVRAHDIYIFLSGERLTTSVRQLWLSVPSTATKSLWNRLVTPMDPAYASIKPMNEMHNLIREGENQRALDVYNRLLPAVKKQKRLLLARLMAAQNVSVDEHQSTVNDFRENFPNDACLDFILIDGYVLKKEFDKSIECIRRVSLDIGGDVWLTSLQGNVLSQAGRFDEAKVKIDEAIKQEPDFKELYFTALSIAILAKNNAEIAANLTKLENDFGVEIADLTEIPDYADFVMSPEYEKWMESRE